VALGCEGRRMTMLAAIFNLNHHAGYAHWHFFLMSVPNIIVILLTLVVFVVAILAPFPGSHRKGAP
jgi:magnesium-transporting ATPase (P-type)